MHSSNGGARYRHERGQQLHAQRVVIHSRVEPDIGHAHAKRERAGLNVTDVPHVHVLGGQGQT
jgi:hypothetical protein